MPIKFPRAFARRKSAGNGLEEVENHPEPSFRVIERPDSGGRSIDKGSPFIPLTHARSSSTPTEDMDNIFSGIEKSLPKNRGSGGTDNSAFSGNPYDSSSSARFSSSSTLPSSTDAPDLHDIPIPPPHSTFSLRAVGRTFSFGNKKPMRPSTPSLEDLPSGSARERAMTASSASTATPPKLMESDFGLGGEEDDFSNVFETFRRSSPRLPESSPSPAIISNSTRKELPPIPLQDMPLRVSPTSFDSHREVLSFSNPEDSGGAVRKDSDATSRQEQDPVILRKSLPLPLIPPPTVQRTVSPSDSVPSLPATSRRSLNRPLGQEPGLKRTSAYSGKRDSAVLEDADAKLLRENLSLNKGTPRPQTIPEQLSPSPIVDESTALFDSDDISSHVRLVTQYEEQQMNRPPANKVMTPAQFEQYRKQKELTRKQSDASRSGSSDASGDYDEKDEDERSREAALHRRRQEAHLSVYRQQMMKVTGEQPLGSSAQLRSSVSKISNGPPTLVNRMSTLDVSADKSGSGKSSDGDEDEDVPLAILQAHGFPHKNRPPTRLAGSSSNPNLHASYRASVSTSVAGDAPANRSSLPVFARNLPKDPYFGAGIVSSSNRESLAMGGGAAGPPPPPPGGPVGSLAMGGGPPALGGPSLPPGGLVGVIATEERARAMRRGSPNAQGTFDPPGSAPPPNGIPRPYTMVNMGQLGGPGQWGTPPPPAISPGEQAQIQVSQQMTQMMQLQMQWMQQMMHMQGVQNGPPAPAPPVNHHFLSPMMMANPNTRPLSMASGEALNSTPNLRQLDPRTLSILDPNMSRWAERPTSIFPDGGLRPDAPGYAPSIAPSERSNIGMASRYRPVSTVPQDFKPMERASTFTASTVRPWNNENLRPSTNDLSAKPPPAERKLASMATVTVRPVGAPEQAAPVNKNGASGMSDDDDDDAWAMMAKQRNEKKSAWKTKSDVPALGDFLHMIP